MVWPGAPAKTPKNIADSTPNDRGQPLPSTPSLVHSALRWSSEFAFPFGASALYEDVSVSATGVSTDRRFFARMGEVIYLMLCRSAHVSELRLQSMFARLRSDPADLGSGERPDPSYEPAPP
jgi:hypothetical protein